MDDLQPDDIADPPPRLTREQELVGELRAALRDRNARAEELRLHRERTYDLQCAYERSETRVLTAQRKLAELCDD